MHALVDLKKEKFKIKWLFYSFDIQSCVGDTLGIYYI